MFQRIGVMVLFAMACGVSTSADDGAWSRLRGADDASWRPAPTGASPFRTVQLRERFDTAAPRSRGRSNGGLDANDGAPNWPNKPTPSPNPWHTVKPSNPWQKVKPSGPRVPLFKFDDSTARPPINVWRRPSSSAASQHSAPHRAQATGPAPNARPAPLKANVAPSPTTSVRRNAPPRPGLNLTGEDDYSDIGVEDTPGFDPHFGNDEMEGEPAMEEDEPTVEEPEFTPRPEPAPDPFPTPDPFPPTPSEPSTPPETPSSTTPTVPPSSTPPTSDGRPLGNESDGGGPSLGNVADDGPDDGAPLGKPATDDSVFVPPTPSGPDNPWASVPTKPGANGTKPDDKKNPWLPKADTKPTNGGTSNPWSQPGSKRPSADEFMPQDSSDEYPHIKAGPGQIGSFPASSPTGNSSRSNAVVGGSIPVGGDRAPSAGNRPPSNSAPRPSPSKTPTESIDSVTDKLAKDVEAAKPGPTSAPKGLPPQEPIKYKTNGKWIEGLNDPPRGQAPENFLPPEDAAAGRPNMGPATAPYRYDPNRPGQKVGDLSIGKFDEVDGVRINPNTGQAEQRSVFGGSIKVDSSGAIRKDSRPTTQREDYQRGKEAAGQAWNKTKEVAGDAVDGTVKAGGQAIDFAGEQAGKTVDKVVDKAGEAGSRAEGALSDAIKAINESLGGKTKPPAAAVPTPRQEAKPGGR